jgi:hypothetical protein
MHSNVPSYTIWPSGPRVFWGDLVTLFWILALAGSRNLQLLVIVSCSSHPRTSFQICNTKGLILKHHHATTVKIVINKKKSREPTIPTELVQKHAKKILPGNGKAITNFNILAKTSLGQRFPVPYLDTFSIAGSRIDGLKIVFRIFRELQTVPGVPQYTICPLECIKTLNFSSFLPLYYPFVVLYLVASI